MPSVRSETRLRTEVRPPDISRAPRRPRRRRWPYVVAAIVVGLIALFYVGGGWYFSGVLHHDALDPSVKHAATSDYRYRVTSIEDGSVTLAIPADAGEVATRGTWGLEWPNGYGQVTTIVSKSKSSVTRSFHLITGSAPGVGTMAALDNKAYPQDPQVGLGIAFQDVRYPCPNGSCPAWFIPGTDDTWAITVHGNSLDRLDTIKMIPTLHAARLPILTIAYRNDVGAPADPSGMLRYGDTEWRDLEAAVRYAVSHGAHDVILVGYSMGGGIAMSFLERSSLASDVDGVILDSPMLDFSRTIDQGASQRTLPLVGLPIPQSLTDVAKWFAGMRYDIDWSGTNYLNDLSGVVVPILLFQGTDDGSVPPATSTELATAKGNLVTYVMVRGADHLDSWNVDPRAYEAAVASFLSKTAGVASGAATG